MLSHFRFHMLVSAIIVFFVYIFTFILYRKKGAKHWTLGKIIVFIAMIINFIPVYAFMNYDVSNIECNDCKELENIKIMSLNVLGNNTKYDDVLSYVKTIDPDVISFSEVTPKWQNNLKILENTYPYFVYNVREDNFGIILYSKLKIISSRVDYYELYDIPSIIVTIESDSGKKVEIIATHIIPPHMGAYAYENDKHLLKLAKFVDNSKIPVIFIGDINDTPWSIGYRKFIKESGLINVALGKFLKPTWVSPFKIGLAIDHIFIKNLKFKKFTIGKYVGSDHMPISAEILF